MVEPEAQQLDVAEIAGRLLGVPPDVRNVTADMLLAASALVDSLHAADVPTSLREVHRVALIWPLLCEQLPRCPTLPPAPDAATATVEAVAAALLMTYAFRLRPDQRAAFEQCVDGRLRAWRRALCATWRTHSSPRCARP